MTGRENLPLPRGKVTYGVKVNFVFRRLPRSHTHENERKSWMDFYFLLLILSFFLSFSLISFFLFQLPGGSRHSQLDFYSSQTGRAETKAKIQEAEEDESYRNPEGNRPSCAIMTV